MNLIMHSPASGAMLQAYEKFRNDCESRCSRRMKNLGTIIAKERVGSQSFYRAGKLADSFERCHILEFEVLLKNLKAAIKRRWK